jgi:TctA family transporter
VALEELAAGLQELMEAGGAAQTTGGFLGVLNTGGNPGLTRNFNLSLLLPLTLLFLGARSLFTSKEMLFPAWYDYLWFGFSTFLMLNRRWMEGTPEAATVPKS